jgi:predicted SAM-dependent methyltransferase
MEGKTGWSLNLGCGDKILGDIVGYKCINIDVRQLEGVDVVCDVKHLPFKDNTFNRVLASDILEHSPISETEGMLSEWSRAMKVGAHMKIRTPSLKWVVNYYARTGDAKFVSYHIFGGQDYAENFHYVIFDNIWLSRLCNQNKMTVIDYKEDYSNFILVVQKYE